MATTKSTTFSDMLNEYLVYSNILEEEFKSQNWLLQNCNMNKGWQGGKLIVPFQQSIASSIKMGGLTDDTDIDYATYKRGYIDGYKEAYGSIYFNSRDLFDHGKLSEQNFLSLLPDQLDQLMAYFKQTVSIQVLGGKALDTVATAFDASTDVLAVNHPERFVIGQKLIVTDGTTTATGYVKAINKNTGVITYVTARGGSTAVDLAGLTEADTKVYIDGGNSTFFQSLKDMLLPASQGGSDSFCNQTKTDSTYTQPVLYDAGGSGGTGDWGTGTGVTKNDILALVFDALRKGYQRGASPTVFLMSYKSYSACLKSVESGSGAYKNIKPQVTYAGYSEIEVGGVQGAVKLVGIREFEDTWIAGINPKYLDMHTGKSPFQLMKSPDGLTYYTKRATSGYTYIADIMLAGDFVYRAPYTAVAIYNIPNFTFN
jgi:hypothetical protein